MHVKNQSAVLLVGPTATAKTLYVSKITNKLPLDKYLPITIPFSPNTSAHFFQDFVITKLQRKSKRVYRAPGGRTAVLFVDDMNMPPQDSMSVQPPLEVLRQYLDHSQWFRMKNNSMVSVEDLLVLCACGLPGGHRKHISSRVLRHFSLFALSPLIDESITKVYSTILFTGFKRNGFATDVMPTVMCIVSATADVLLWLTQTLLPTPNKPHYAFSLRDFAKLIHSHLLVKRENVDSKRVFIR
ncbi:Dynein heavy chain 12, axonemal [Homalodisca vitripennis]|nr:Dynein heavy chain 12, axonemal [Homalodisca vitripennis]